jgi:hypothetical protein
MMSKIWDAHARTMTGGVPRRNGFQKGKDKQRTGTGKEDPGGCFVRKTLKSKMLPWDYVSCLPRKYGKPSELSSNAPAYF